MKKGFHVDIETKTISNTDFRRVLYTAEHLQLVLMSIKPGEEIGSEVHKGNDQFFRVEEGTGKVIISGETYVVSDGDTIIVPAGAEHNIINTSDSASLRSILSTLLPIITTECVIAPRRKRKRIRKNLMVRPQSKQKSTRGCLFV